MPTAINRPSEEEYPAIYQDYMDRLPEGDILYILEKQAVDLRYMFRHISDERAEEAYAEGKWTMKELLQHLIDAERIFGYRALCFSRGEETPLPGWDEARYVYNSLANIRPLENILDEYELTRRSNLAMFRSFTFEMLNNYGQASGRTLSLRGLIHVMAAHELHHMHMLENYYLKKK
ncbi:DinB family protein [Pontibacter sp. E15-1]|uniref:DinB family protein n=1 Tax=Pontibacter sp. E15-1 TaxID=2919918 RepID=UPI001F4FBCFC|nr:DinB family protein [Pontibacter sp. E15-1]MCJ8166300.1 DinB family protein [Pontibacter sp. E15-1]